MMIRLNTYARRLLRDSKGFGAMELALSLPFILFLCLGMIDGFNMVATKIDYERAAQQTTDFALAKRPNTSDGTYLKTIASSAAGVATADVTVDIFLECDGNEQTDFTAGCASGETLARYVSVEIRKAHLTTFDWAALSRALGVNGFSNSITVTGDSLVRIQ